MGFFDHLLRDIRSVIDRDGGQNAIPPLDGALSPNDRLDTAVPIGEPLPGVDDVIAAGDGAIYASAGRQVLKLSGADFSTRAVIAEFEDDAGGLALHPDGRLLVCIAGRALPRSIRQNPRRAGWRPPAAARSPGCCRSGRRPMAAFMRSRAAPAAAQASGGTI